MFAYRCTIITALLFVLVGSAFADTIYLNDGGTIKGLVVEEHYDRVLFSMHDGEKTIFRKDIDEIFYDELEQNYYYLANKFLDESDFESAEKFYIKALEVNPDLKLAKEALGRLKDRREKDINKYKAPNPLSILRNQIGISIRRIGDFCVINKVFRKNSSLHKGDRIVSIWDESTKFMDEVDVAKRMIGFPDEEVKITIQRDASFCSTCILWYFRIFGKRKEETLPLKMDPEGLTVGRLTKGSLTEKAGLKEGDRIVAIDNEPTRYVPIEKASSIIHREAPKEVTLTIQRDIKLIRTK